MGIERQGVPNFLTDKLYNIEGRERSSLKTTRVVEKRTVSVDKKAE
jgi:hypothetical protein